ncbi:MAG: hypothetical protein IT518_03490 [Burkholderiales bacterium]|nr:hypothetical protein [Burkholderiales bacterium]
MSKHPQASKPTSIGSGGLILFHGEHIPPGSVGHTRSGGRAANESELALVLGPRPIGLLDGTLTLTISPRPPP